MFCAGAGLDPSVLASASPEETMRKAGELLRIAVDGLMTVLNSRRTLKNEFRLLATEFRSGSNSGHATEKSAFPSRADIVWRDWQVRKVPNGLRFDYFPIHLHML